MRQTMCNVHTRYRLLHLCIVTRTLSSGCLQHCISAKYTCITSSQKFFWYESMKWNLEENFSMEWNMKWKIFRMEWK